MERQPHLVILAELFEQVMRPGGRLGHDDFGADVFPELEEAFGLVRLAVEIGEHAGNGQAQVSDPGLEFLARIFGHGFVGALAGPLGVQFQIAPDLEVAQANPCRLFQRFKEGKAPVGVMLDADLPAEFGGVGLAGFDRVGKRRESRAKSRLESQRAGLSQELPALNRNA